MFPPSWISLLHPHPTHLSHVLIQLYIEENEMHIGLILLSAMIKQYLLHVIILLIYFPTQQFRIATPPQGISSIHSPSQDKELYRFPLHTHGRQLTQSQPADVPNKAGKALWAFPPHPSMCGNFKLTVKLIRNPTPSVHPMP